MNRYEVEVTARFTVLGDDPSDAQGAVEDSLLGHDMPHIFGIPEIVEFRSVRQVEGKDT